MIIINHLRARLNLYKVKYDWRKKNSNNGTRLKRIESSEKIVVGNYSYGTIDVHSDEENHKLHIGNYVSIGDDTLFLLGADHHINTISTFPFKTKICNQDPEGISRGDIIVEDDVWIGHGVTVMSGVRIGQGAIIGAESLVTKDVPPYTIVGGVPAKEIRKRFSDDIIEYMMTLDFSKLDKEMIEAHLDEMYIDISTMKPEEIRELYAWFPKK